MLGIHFFSAINEKNLIFFIFLKLTEQTEQNHIFLTLVFCILDVFYRFS